MYLDFWSFFSGRQYLNLIITLLIIITIIVTIIIAIIFYIQLFQVAMAF